MTYRIPVFFLPVADIDQVDAETAQEIIGNAFDSPEVGNLTTSVSTNWWHQKLTLAVCKSIGLQGLDFLEHEVSCLSTAELRSASSALKELLGHLENQGMPNIDQPFGPELEAISTAHLPAAIADALPSSDIDDDTGDVPSFLAFLVSLHRSATRATDSGERLLWYQPQP